MQDIFVSDIGKGFPLVLVHGFLGSSEMWTPQIDYFKKEFRVISPDLPGFGRSNSLQSCSSIECMAAVIIKYLKKKNIDKFHLVGHSMGGMIVQEIVRTEGVRVSKLICYGTGPRGSMPGRFETLDQSRERLKKTGLNITVKRIAKTWFVNSEKAKYYNLCLDSGNSASLKAADKALLAMKNWNGEKFLKEIVSQTLIVWGDQDKAYNYEQIKTLKDNIPNSKLKIFKGFSHNVHLEAVDEFNKTIIKFLKF